MRRDQASPISLVPSMHLTEKHIFALLLLLIVGGIDTNPDPTPCAICHRSNWNQSGVWCGQGGWVQLNFINLHSIEQWNNKFDCMRCSWWKEIETNTRQIFSNHNNINLKIHKLNCNGLKHKADSIIDSMKKHDIQTAAIQETNLNEKSTLKSQPGSCINQENRTKKRSNGRVEGFIIKDTILFQELKLKTSDKHLEVQDIEHTTSGNNIKIVNTYIPPSSCDAGSKTSISKLLGLEDCIIVGYFDSHTLYGTQKLPPRHKKKQYCK